MVWDVFTVPPIAFTEPVVPRIAIPSVSRNIFTPHSRAPWRSLPRRRLRRAGALPVLRATVGAAWH
eukprot:4825251-Prymnesium_polylepis.1